MSGGNQNDATQHGESAHDPKGELPDQTLSGKTDSDTR
jgi:hypothetical protein